MKVGVWDHLPSALFATSGEDSPVEFVRVPAREAAERLDLGRLDAALLPTLTIMLRADDYDAFPAVGFSSWDYPYARLFVEAGLKDPLTSLVHDGTSEMALLVARIVLREHYGARVEIAELAADEVGTHVSGAGRVELVLADAITGEGDDAHVLDLGREWFELAAYPMVWGLFAAPKGEATPDAIVALRDAVVAAEKHLIASAGSVDAPTRDFLTNHARLRVDDLAIASLTEFANYVYYYGVLEDYPDVPFVSLPEDEANGNGTSGPLFV